ncbi:hypothetical protein FA13DRAFT_1776145 [Coprinellus micaceus]|uniref:F-box domain-containing protein n=1 Tax=Coprinellus micaceus TaxID=71717 RepID=A0A4Y7T389_COPMI|nr:hypothetical protein FA13DRAFT_1776145 [Coprinellus micaceus]
MLQLLSRRENTVFNSLLNCNAPPNDDQRAEINGAIQALKIRYQQASGTEYSPTHPIPQSGRKYHDKILRYQRMLAPVRTIPPEIWHRVFKYAILTVEPKTQQSLVLRDLRLVSRMWNATAIDCPVLWCNLPLIDHSIIPTTPENSPKQPHSTWTLIQYLTRARCPKPLPISFTFHCSINSGDESEVQARALQARAWVEILALDINRWGEVEFLGTRAFQETLLDLLYRRSRQGGFPLLSKFSFQRRGIDTANSPRYTTWRETLDLSKAPLLKYVVYDSLNPFQGPEHLSFHGTITYLILPWGQLETFRGAVQGGEIYPYLLDGGTNLQVLKHTSNQATTLPSTPASLPYLTKLSLCFGDAMPGENIVAHLGQSLTLPSLKELEVYWGRFHKYGVDIYGGILSLILRSRCSLERLAVEHNELDYDLNLQKERFQQVLYQCPCLTHLDIAYLDAAKLQTLVPDFNTAKKPPLSRLRVLTLRQPYRQGIKDPLPLLRVFLGRTDPTRRPPHDHLEEVYIKHDDRDLWRNVILELGTQKNDETIQRLETPFDPSFYAVALSWKEGLRKDVATPSVSNSGLTEQRRSEIKELMRGMESYNLQGRDTRVLTWLGVPALLESVGRNKRGKPISGNPIAEYRKQAGEILTKWKPFLLADFQSSQYRYSFADSSTSRLNFVETTTSAGAGKEGCGLESSSVKCEDRNGDYEDWDKILGRAPVDSWAAALKGAAWLLD